MAVSNVELIVNATKAINPLKRVRAETEKLESATRDVKGRFIGVGKGATAAAGGVNVLSAAIKAIPFIGAAEAARRFFAGFAEADKAAAAVRSLGVDSQKLRSQLLAVSNETKGLASQTELLKASYDVASAGFNDAASAAKILKAATLGAVGGLSDINTVADATTSVLNAYGLASNKAAKIVDGFIQTQNDGKIVVAEYAQQIGRIAPIAAAAGVGIEDLNAAISAVTATGVPVESTFAGLRQAIASVIKPTAEARKTAQLLGLEFSSAAIKTKGFGGFLEDVIKKTGGSEVALTQLFDSVEAVTAIMPLANDGLEKFNTSLDNQKKSAGAAEKATKDLGGTVSSQVSSIINNIGNVARSLDTVLGPAIKNIVTGVNDVISAVSTAISKFQDLATGALSRSAAALQFAASTGTASEGAFIALKEAVGTLRPELANSKADLLKLEGALDEAGRAALRFTGKGEFGRLRNDVLDTITAMRKLILSKREALAQQGGKQKTKTEDLELIALRERVNQLLQQLSADSGTGKATKERVDMSEKMLKLLRERIELSKGENKVAIALKENEMRMLEIQESSLLPREKIAAQLEAEEMLHNDLRKIHGENLQLFLDQKAAAESLGKTVAKDYLKRLEEAAEPINQLYASIGQSIETGIVDALSSAVDGTKKLADVASDVLRNIANILLQFGVNTALGGIPGLDKFFGGARAKGGTVTGGRSYMVGEKGPELFTPGRTGSIAPSGSFGETNVVVNVDASGSQAQGNQPSAKALGAAIGAAVQAELIKQKRPGGLLS